MKRSLCNRPAKRRIALIGLFFMLSLFCLFGAMAFAQQSVVEGAKSDLARAGFPVENVACSDFEIAKVVAGRLAAQGAGLLQKDCCDEGPNDPNRSHCFFNGVWYAHDIVTFSTGHGVATEVDIASDGGGHNGPQWDGPHPSDYGRYRSAIALGLTGLVGGVPTPPMTPPVTPPPPSPAVDLKPLSDRLDRLQANVTDLLQRVLEMRDALGAHVERPLGDIKFPAQKCVRGKLSYIGTVTFCPVD